jgi:parallel beta-helix repeat protein
LSGKEYLMKYRALCVMIMIIALVPAFPALARDYHVNPGDSIQAAINGAGNGDRIFVHAGSYNEQIVIDEFKGLSIIGDGKNSTFIEGNSFGSGNMVSITDSDNVVFKKFTVQNGPSDGIHVDAVEKVSILNCKIDGNGGNGIEYQMGLGFTVKNCVISFNTRHGISFTSESVGSVVKGNLVEWNDRTGIYHSYGMGDLIADNDVYDNQERGIYNDSALGTRILRNKVKRNIEIGIRDTTYGALKNKIADNVVTDNGGYGISVYQGSRVLNNKVMDNGSNGIYMQNTGNILMRNTVTGSGSDGIYGEETGQYAERNFVDDNQGDGMYFNQYDTTVIKNTVTNNDSEGLHLNQDLAVLRINFVDMNDQVGMWHSNDAVVAAGNTVTNNGDRGIAVDEYSNVISRNLVVNNSGDGIGYRCVYAIISGNNVRKNTGDGISDLENCVVKENLAKGNNGSGINSSRNVFTDDFYGSLIKNNTARGNGNGVTTFDLHDDDPRDDFWKKNRHGTHSW